MEAEERFIETGSHKDPEKNACRAAEVPLP